MKVRVTATVIIDTDKVQDGHHKMALERLAWNQGDNLDKLWAWGEAQHNVKSENIKIELL